MGLERGERQPMVNTFFVRPERFEVSVREDHSMQTKPTLSILVAHRHTTGINTSMYVSSHCILRIATCMYMCVLTASFILWRAAILTE